MMHERPHCRYPHLHGPHPAALRIVPRLGYRVPMSDPESASTAAREHAQRALAEGDAATALHWIDALPADQHAPLLAQVWMLAGSPRAVARVLPDLRSSDDPALAERAAAFVRAPPSLEIATSDAPDPYASLLTQAARLATLGRAAELAMTHLGLALVSPRVDWRAVHIDHAAGLALGLGDDRLSALVRAFEAERELSFGEYEDALEAAHAAIEQGTLADEPRAIERATRVKLRLAGLPTAAPQDLDGLFPEDRTTEPEDL